MKLIPVILAFILVMMCPAAVLAQESAKYNFASAQGSKDIKVIPDGESSGILYFYNIDGNQITHVVLEVSQAPADWQVTIQPPLGETRVEINGKVVTVNENLYIEPSQVLSEKVENLPAGTVCITVPQRGYALAKEAKILVRVPKTERIGTTGEIVVSATAQWLGQSGAVAIKQNRDFNFSVEVISETTGFTEKILGPSNASSTVRTTGKWLPVILGVAGAVVVVLLILLYVRRRRD
jgi:hypothetical protein